MLNVYMLLCADVSVILCISNIKSLLVKSSVIFAIKIEISLIEITTEIIIAL